jgi:2,3-bisphosphoglycerate-dependent phosphoglycerate mutase
MAKLFLLRHLKSRWNSENRFAGWIDIPLDKNDLSRAKDIAKKLSEFKIDAIYSSELFRNKDTVVRVITELEGDRYPIFIHLDKGKMKDWGNFTDISENDIPVYTTEILNERYYGKFQGIDKEIAKKEYGEEKVHLWRRSYNVAPPDGESLKDVVKRVRPFLKKFIEKELKAGKNVLIVASHNPLRAIAKEIENIPDDKIINFEIPFGGLLEYELDDKLKVLSKMIL